MTQQDDGLKATAEKKPYVAPKLVHLGSVRELTADNSGSARFDSIIVGSMRA